MTEEELRDNKRRSGAGFYGRTTYRDIAVEKLQVNCRKMLDDQGLGLHAILDVWPEMALRSMVMELTAYVTAAKREEKNEWNDVRVPARPVRDGLLVAIWRHTDAEWLAKWIEGKIHWRNIRTQHQHQTYYGCPHIGTPAGDRSHIMWLDQGE